MSKSINKEKERVEIIPSEKLLFETIDILRFPLAILVIFVHMNPNVINLPDADFALVSGHGIYNVVGIILSHVLSGIAVPTFYLISGFLFFVNFQEWSWSGYKNKINSRVHTLGIPYFLWNFVPFVILVLAMSGGVLLGVKSIDSVYDIISDNGWHIFYDCNEWGTTRINWLGQNLRMTGPWNLALWFLRDLIVVTLLTPLVYWTVKELRIFIVLFLFVAYTSRIWTLMPGFNITAFFYFTLGSYFALNKINIVLFANKYASILIPVCIITFIVTTIYDGSFTVIGQNFLPIFVCTGVFTAFLIASKCITIFKVAPNKLLLSSCFFIYAFHAVRIPVIGPPLAFIYKVLHIVIPGNSELEEGISYLLTPFLTALLCMFVLHISRRIAPRITLLFSGNK